MGQTILPYDQNLLESLENATQIEKKNDHVKENTGQVVLPQFSFLNAFEIENSMSP